MVKKLRQTVQQSENPTRTNTQTNTLLMYRGLLQISKNTWIEPRPSSFKSHAGSEVMILVLTPHSVLLRSNRCLQLNCHSLLAVKSLDPEEAVWGESPFALTSTP
jgi:hypothetical protein